MALETGTYISDLVASNPTPTDPKSQGDDHLRLIKSAIKATFPNISGAVTATHAQLNDVANKVVPGGALGTPSSGNLSNTTADGSSRVGFRDIPQNSKSAAYTLVAEDAGEHIYHPSSDTTARTWTIPANTSVPFPIGTAITFINGATAGVITIAITSDTMRLAGIGATGSRTLAASGVATAIKVTTTEWIISGSGLT